ncbi:MAG: SEC-C metal-binding domain-containing protein [Ilumatobacteraceae bacterium]
MFGSMMKGIAQDFVKYVMHVQVVRKEAPAARGAERAADLERRSHRQRLHRCGQGRDVARRSNPRPSSRWHAEAAAAAPVKQQTVVKDEWAKTPRNAPCPCGSGKKFKMCHGADV